MHILLINAPVSRMSPHAHLSPPLGLAYIASALIMDGHTVKAIDFNIGGSRYKIEERITGRNRPDIVGISAHTETYPNALALAKKIKTADKNIQIVMGGPHPSILPKEVLEHEAIDFVVIGEGEKTMRELVRYLDSGTSRLKNIKGLAYKDEEIIINGRREISNPMESFYPARELFPLEFYQNKWNILTARGSCPFKCSFCSASFLWDGQRKARTPESVLDEAEMLIHRHDAHYIFFSDDLFTMDRKWVFKLLNLLNIKDYHLEWGCATRVDLIDRTMLKAMAVAGCRTIQFGVESGSQKIMNSVKGIGKEQVLNVIRTAQDEGISTASSFMIPFPEDTKETLEESIEFMKRIHKEGSKILLSYTTPYPGTYLYENADVLGIRILANRWEEFDSKHTIIETKYLSKEDIKDYVDEILTFNFG